MEIQNAVDFINDVSSDDYFAIKNSDWYNSDTILILNRTELKEMHQALTDWVSNASIVECQTMGRVNALIGQYLKTIEGED